MEGFTKLAGREKQLNAATLSCIPGGLYSFVYLRYHVFTLEPCASPITKRIYWHTHQES